MIRPRFFLLALICVAESCIGAFLSFRAEAQSGRKEWLIDQPDGPRPAAGLQGGVPLCKSAGISAAPHLRSPPSGEKRPRLSSALPLVDLISIRLNSAVLTAIAANNLASYRGAKTDEAAAADLAAIDDALRKRDYERVLRLLSTLDGILARETAKKIGTRFASRDDYARYVEGTAALHAYLGYFKEAVGLYCVALNLHMAAYRHGHNDVAHVLHGTALALIEQGRDAEVEDILERFRRTVEEMPGIGHSDYNTRKDAYLSLLDIYAKQGRFKEAEEALVKATAAAKKSFTSDSALKRAYEIFLKRGRHGEAEKVAKDLVRSGAPLVYLASVYHSQGRYDDALDLYESMWKLLEREPSDAYHEFRYCSVGVELAHLRIRKDRARDALPVLVDAVKYLRSRFEPRPGCLAQTLATYGLAQLELEQTVQAEVSFKEAVEVAKQTGDELDTALRLADLGYFYRRTKNLEAARALVEQALKLRLPRLGSGHPYVAADYRDLALIAAQQRQWRAAYDHARTAIGMMFAYEGTEYQRSVETWGTGERTTDQKLFSVLIRAVLHLGLTDAKATEEFFLAAQRLQMSKAGNALMLAAARTISAGSSADLLREREELVARLESSWKRLSTATLEAGALDLETRSQILRNLLGLVRDYEHKLRDIDGRLGGKVADYAAFSGLTALHLAEVAPLLRADQMLLQFLELPTVESLPTEVVVLAVTKDTLKYFRADLGGTPLKTMVATLRCGLDRSGEWIRPKDPRERWKGRTEECKALLPHGLGRSDKLPFSLAKAHALFQSLLGPIKEDIVSKHLLVVSSGPLSSLPLHVLVTAPPKNVLARVKADFQGVAWLARSNAVTVIPSVASLKALAGRKRLEHATIAYMGFGNPLLDGDGSPKEVEDARLARAWRTCADVDAPPSSTERGVRTLRMSLDDLLPPAKELAKVENIRGQAPLPETAMELCQVAKSLRVSMEHVYLGARATKKVIGELNKTGILGSARVIHFATHAFLANDTEAERIFGRNRGEAALFLTPPPHGGSDKELAEDDGLLTVSEIAQLKLNADWVVLSACNTAGGDRAGGEALSGLARAFFFAGARALLASHWYVDSHATTPLVSATFQELARDPSITRAKALRRSMQKMFDGPIDFQSHPTYWAAFVVVGGLND